MIEGTLGRVRWWFTDRAGGESAGTFASLNLGAHVGDDIERVMANRARLATTLALPTPDSWVWMNQVHGATVVDADQPVIGLPDADAAVTTTPGLPLVVMTADCAPILLIAGEGEAIGVVHAGWAGLAGGVINAGVDALRARSRAPITAVLGPCISARHYEFGADALVPLVEQFGPSIVGETASGSPALDVPEAVRIAMKAAGVERFDDVGVCTYASSELFSYRRDGQTGRQALVAVLT